MSKPRLFDRPSVRIATLSEVVAAGTSAHIISGGNID